jgi:hypothetical protein
MTDLFSERMGANKPRGGLIQDAAPEAVVNGLLNFLMTLPGRTLYGLESTVRIRLDILQDGSGSWDSDWPSVFKGFFDKYATNKNWYRFYDICEIVWEGLDPSPDRDALENHLNRVFQRNHVGYEMRQGNIERVGSRVADEVVAAARGILTDERLAGPDEQFSKALAFFNQRPKPDLENAVKEAIGAAEGLASVIAGQKIQLNKAIKKWSTDGLIPPTISKAIDSIYAYRGDAEGVAHGKSGTQGVRMEEAEFVLHASAAIIVYLARLHGYSVT